MMNFFNTLDEIYIHPKNMHGEIKDHYALYKLAKYFAKSTNYLE